MTDSPDAPDAEKLASDLKKPELQALAEVQGVDIPSGATKATIAEAIVAQSTPSLPVIVDGRTKRSDDDALEGGWVRVVDGEHAGRRGALLHVEERGADGYPTRCIIRTRDAMNQLLSVAYEHLRPTHAGR